MTHRISIGAIVGAIVLSALTAMPAFADGGTISGKINFDGKMVEGKKIRVSQDAYCTKFHEEHPLHDETFVFNMDKGTLCNVIVYVSSPVTGTFPTPEPAKIEQLGCQYRPHVLAMTVGQKLVVTNDDNTAHNLNLKAANNPGFNESQPVKGMTKDASFAKAEFEPPMYLKCDVHAWMNARIAVFDNPFHAVSDSDGNYKIEGLPPGKYTIKTWQDFDRFAPAQESYEVEVKDGQTTNLDITYKVKGK